MRRQGGQIFTRLSRTQSGDMVPNSDLSRLLCPT